MCVGGVDCFVGGIVSSVFVVEEPNRQELTAPCFCRNEIPPPPASDILKAAFLVTIIVIT